MIAIGHAVVEMPLILLLVAGVGGLLQSSTARAGIGLAGGAVLLFLGLQLLLGVRKAAADSEASVQRHPLLIGIVLTAANPSFLVWWACDFNGKPVGMTNVETASLAVLALDALGKE